MVRLRYLVRGLSSNTRLEIKAINADEVETTVWEKKAEIEGHVQRGHFVYTIQTGTQVCMSVSNRLAKINKLCFLLTSTVNQT